MSRTTDEQPTPPGDRPGATRVRPGPLDHLRRSRTDRKVAGVAGGLGRYLDVDPTILRVLFVVACFFGGAGFLLYVAAWLLVPEDGTDRAPLALQPAARNALLVTAAVVAALILVGNSWGGIGAPWPLLVIGVGVVAYLVLRDRGAVQAPRPWAAGPPVAPLAPGPPMSPPVPPWAPGPPIPAPTATAVEPVTPRRPVRRGPLLFGPTLAVVAVALGCLGLYDVAGGQVADTAYPALAVALVGLALVLAAFVGRGGGLVLLGVVAVLALSVTAVVSAAGGYGTVGRGGERVTARPVTAAGVQASYEVPSGRIVLDLRRVRDPQALVGRTLDVGARAGELVVMLPAGVTSHVAARVTGPGQIDLPGRTVGGLGIASSQTLGSGRGAVDLRVHLFAGHIDVRSTP